MIDRLCHHCRPIGWGRQSLCLLSVCVQVTLDTYLIRIRTCNVEQSTIRFPFLKHTADILLLSLLNRMPSIFSAAIGFSPAPAAVAHATALLSQLEIALPLHFGSLINPLDPPITRFFIACVRALVLCAACHTPSCESDTAELTAAVAAAVAAGDAVAAAASDPASACVSTLHSCGLFSFLGSH